MNKNILIIFGIGFLISFLFFVGRFIIVGCGIHGDGVEYYSILRSIIFDKDFDVTNEYYYFATTPGKFSNKPRWGFPETSPNYSRHPIGLSLLWLPFYILGHIISYILVEVFRLNLRVDGFGVVYEFMVCLGSFIYGSLGLILAYKLLNKFFSKNISIVALLGIWFATSFTFYYMIDPSISHACAFFVINCFLYILFTREKTYLNSFILGLLAGLAVLVRLQDIAVLIIPLIDMFIRRKNFIFYFLLMVVAFCVCLPQILIYKSLFSSLYSTIYLTHMSAGGFLNNILAFSYIIKVLFGKVRGLFTWTPITLPAIISLFISIKRFKLISLPLLLFFLIEVYISASYTKGYYNYFNLIVTSGGVNNLSSMEALLHSFGMRYLISCSFCFLFGLGYLLSYIKRYKLIYKISLIFIGILIIHNILFIFQFLLETFPQRDNINFYDILKNQFTIIFKLILTLEDYLLR